MEIDDAAFDHARPQCYIGASMFAKARAQIVVDTTQVASTGMRASANCSRHER